MTGSTGDRRTARFCKACGTPAGNGKLCEHCGAALDLPDPAGLVEDEGAAARRTVEGRDEGPEK
ncbi:hypothetical protein [Streptomyces sp. NBC_00306]|uniref:hypothetical protein n=1 Tax=Streptomyces sp. NBC_00306 TaxID=2975708 RepID=UPI002E2CEFDA|nr:hypothetical protein [Streptomyces sp. NBC_00306]